VNWCKRTHLNCAGVHLPFLFFTLLFAPSSFAMDAIVVTATKNGTPRAELPLSVDKITGDDWEQAGEQAETALQSVPGLSFSASGGAGQTRSVFLRGARAEDTLVLLDGIPLNDPLSPSRAFDFSQIPASEIESIEVLKGPQSVLYGSDAIGGVVQLFSKREGSRARFEAGSYGSMRLRASHLGLQGGFERSDGFSSADEANGNREKDGHKSWNLGGTRDFSLSERTSLRVQGQYHSARTDTDRNGGAGGDSPGTFTRNHQLLFKAETFHLSRSGFEFTHGATILDRERDDNTVAPAFYRASRWRAETGVKKKFGPHLPALGAEFSAETGRSSEISGRRRFRTGGFYAQNQFTAGRWQAVLGARMDFHGEHGRATTFRTGLGYWIAPETLRARFSLGNGFKAPSLYQTYSSYGTPGLRPSRTIGGDFGFDLTSGPWGGELVYFQNRFRDLIDFESTSSRYFNIGRAKSEGVEAGLARKIGLLSAKASYTYLTARDQNTRLRLLRRPIGSGAASLTFTPTALWETALRLRYVGTREDIHPSLFVRQRMPSFFVWSAFGGYEFKPGWKVQGRVENLFNRHYQETSGFGSPGLSGYAGLEADL
jgi:vitamin B12 transporter